VNSAELREGPHISVSNRIIRRMPALHSTRRASCQAKESTGGCGYRRACDPAAAPIHANDHVNRSQSTNDAYASAALLAADLRLADLAQGAAGMPGAASAILLSIRPSAGPILKHAPRPRSIWCPTWDMDARRKLPMKHFRKGQRSWIFWLTPIQILSQ